MEEYDVAKKEKAYDNFEFTALQLKRCNKKGCELFVIKVTKESKANKDKVKEKPIIK